MVAGAAGGKAADDHAARAAQHVDGVRSRGQRERHAVQVGQRGRRKALDARCREGGQQEERPAHPHLRQPQEPQHAAAGGLGARPAHGAAHLARVQHMAQHHQHGQHHEGHHRGRRQRHAPAGQVGDGDQEQRRRGPAQVSGNAVYREGMAQPRLRHVLVQQREVGRMEHAVAQPRHRRAGQQRGIAVAGRQQQRRAAQEGQPGKQHRPRAEAVHHEARGGLHHRRHGEEHRHQQAQLRIAQAELGLDPREQGRQQQVIEMRDPMRQPDQPDHLGVMAKRIAGGFEGGGGHGAGGKVL
ncbi:hypothetical protein D9M72_392650 [compost metagenome]